MSALIFYTDATQALVVTDTLSADARTGAPISFCSKAIYLPHLRIIIAGTGIKGFSDHLAFKVNKNGVFRGIEGMNHFLPAELRSQWAELQGLVGAIEVTTTVYAFGFSEIDGAMVSFAYRSTNDFQSELLGYGTAVKPACAVPDGNLIDHVESMMREQRASQGNTPLDNRIHIGGEGIAMHLTQACCTTWPLFRFEDCAQQLEAMIERHRATASRQ